MDYTNISKENLNYLFFKQIKTKEKLIKGLKEVTPCDFKMYKDIVSEKINYKDSNNFQIGNIKISNQEVYINDKKIDCKYKVMKFDIYYYYNMTKLSKPIDFIIPHFDEIFKEDGKINLSKKIKIYYKIVLYKENQLNISNELELLINDLKKIQNISKIGMYSIEEKAPFDLIDDLIKKNYLEKIKEKC